MRWTFWNPSDVRTISLADTVGLAGPEQIRELFSAVLAKFDYLEIGVAPAQPSGAGSREDRWPPMTPAAAASIPPLAGWEDVRLRRMRWWETFRPRKFWRRCSKRGAELPALKPLDALLRVTAEIGAKYTGSRRLDARTAHGFASWISADMGSLTGIVRAKLGFAQDDAWMIRRLLLNRCYETIQLAFDPALPPSPSTVPRSAMPSASN